MKNRKLYADIRGGCCAIYFEDRKGDTNGCHSDDERNLAFSMKDAKYNSEKGYWEMDEEVQDKFRKLVELWNESIDEKEGESK